MTLNNLVFLLGSPQEPSTCAVPTTKVLPQKDTTRPKVQKNAKFLHFFHFPSFSFILPPHFPSSTMYQFHPKILHFGTCFRHSACVFFIVLTHLQQKKDTTLSDCAISQYYFLLYLFGLFLFVHQKEQVTSRHSHISVYLIDGIVRGGTCGFISDVVLAKEIPERDRNVRAI